jgi:hypothetical protein
MSLKRNRSSSDFKSVMGRLLAVPKNELDRKVRTAKKRSPRVGNPNAQQEGLSASMENNAEQNDNADPKADKPARTTKKRATKNNPNWGIHFTQVTPTACGRFSAASA